MKNAATHVSSVAMPSELIETKSLSKNERFINTRPTLRPSLHQTPENQTQQIPESTQSTSSVRPQSEQSIVPLIIFIACIILMVVILITWIISKCKKANQDRNNTSENETVNNLDNRLTLTMSNNHRINSQLMKLYEQRMAEIIKKPSTMEMGSGPGNTTPSSIKKFGAVFASDESWSKLYQKNTRR